MTPDRSARKVGLLDIMILVAATALGLAGVGVGRPRDVTVVSPTFTLSSSSSTTPSPSPVVTIVGVVTTSGPGYPSTGWMRPAAEHLVPLLLGLVAWTGAYLIARLRSPRPRRRRLLAQPGLVSAVAVLSALAVESSLLVGSAWVDGRFLWSNPTVFARFAGNGVILLAHHAGWAVAIAWATQALVGRWRPEPSWLDRLGRALGTSWVVVGVLSSLLVDQTTWWGGFLGN